MSPVSSEIKGETASITLSVSGGAGPEPRHPAAEPGPRASPSGSHCRGIPHHRGGSIQQSPGPNGLVNLSFSRKTGATDSGTLCHLEIGGPHCRQRTGAHPGRQYLVGTSNPFPARVVNALITVN